MTPEEALSEAANLVAELWDEVGKNRDRSRSALAVSVVAFVVALAALGFAIIAAP